MHVTPTTVAIAAATLAISAGATWAIGRFAALRLRPDVLVRPADARAHRDRRIARNVGAALIALVGLLLLAIPGPGMLTLVAALGVSDFGAKRRLLRRLLARERVLRAVNRIRARHGKPAITPAPAPAR